MRAANDPLTIGAAYKPQTGHIALLVDDGVIDLDLHEARSIHTALIVALLIADGRHPAQTGAAPPFDGLCCGATSLTPDPPGDAA